VAFARDAPAASHSPGVSHRASHHGLLHPVHQRSARRLDAIVVPTWRPVEHLRTAFDLAAQFDCPLVAITGSGGPRPGSIRALTAEYRNLELRCLDIGTGYQHPLLSFPENPRGITTGSASLSTKRNLALLFGRLLRWRTIFFLDDDVHDIQPVEVHRAASALGPLRAIGLQVANFPDNSVVCHANRATGGDQDVFVSGSALLVDMTNPIDFFPEVYNDDWLFLYEWVRRRQVGRYGRARQLPYRPFARPERAAREEFGDVVAEGLMAAVREERPLSTCTAEYWSDFIAARTRFVDEIIERAGAQPESVGRTELLNALTAANESRAQFDGSDCSDFVQQWRNDRRVWRTRLRMLERYTSFEDAATRLNFRASSDDEKIWTTCVEDLVNESSTPSVTVARTGLRDGDRSKTTAILLPGFLDSKDYTFAVELAAALPSIGVEAFQFDLLGSWTTPADTVDYTVSLHLAQIDELVERSRAEGASRCILIGYCYGGHLALLQAARHSHVTDVAALMPTQSFIWSSRYDEDRDTWREAGERAFLRGDPYSTRTQEYRIPYPVVTDARAYNLDEALTSLRTRVLFVGGTKDKVVPVETVQEMYNRCGQTDRQLTILPGVRHEYARHVRQTFQVTSTVLDWIKRAGAPTPLRRSPSERGR
jgi:pimeloyl-ACP methyl ester carboxylesterase